MLIAITMAAVVAAVALAWFLAPRMTEETWDLALMGLAVTVVSAGSQNLGAYLMGGWWPIGRLAYAVVGVGEITYGVFVMALWVFSIIRADEVAQS